MNTSTPADAATWPRAVADLLERSAPAPLTVHLMLDVSRYRTTLTEAERVAAVDGVASALGLTARATKATTYWEYQAQRIDGACHLAVSTDIAGPLLCACGAACTHHDPTAIAA